MWRPDSVYDDTGHVDEGVIHAWLDGALAADSATAVEAHAHECGVCAGRIAEARGMVAGARRILGALDDGAVHSAPVVTAVSEGDRSGAAAPGPVRPLRTWSTRRVSLAAAAVLMLAAGSLVVGDQLGRGTASRESSRAVRAETAAPASLGSAPAGAEAADQTAASAPGGNSLALQAAVQEPMGVRERAGVPERTSRGSHTPGRTRATGAEMSVPAGAVAAMKTAPAPSAPSRSSPIAAPLAPIPPPPAATDVAASAPPDAPAAPQVMARSAAPRPAREDSLRRRMLNSPSVALEAVVVTGTASSSQSAAAVRGELATLLRGCWRVDGVDGSVSFVPSGFTAAPEASAPAMAAPSGRADEAPWRLGHQLVQRGRPVPFQWRTEGAPHRVRVRVPGRTEQLLLDIRGDSLVDAGDGNAARTVRGRRARCP